MQFKDTSTKLGLIEACEMKLFGDNGYGQISGNTNRLYQFTARLNRGQDNFAIVAISADGKWKFDDTNNTDYPEATTDINSGQRDYPLAVSMMEIDSVSILISSTTNQYSVIYPMNLKDGSAISEAFIENNPANVGIPIAYNKEANSIVFNCTPNYGATAGLKVRFKRGANYFVYTDTTKVPGFPALFHEYLASHASLGYAKDRIMASKIPSLTAEVTAWEEKITDFFSKRAKDEAKFINPTRRSSR